MDLLTDIQICELMGWRYGTQTKLWFAPGIESILSTPDFDTMNPWHEFVIPWWKREGVVVNMSMMVSHKIKLFPFGKGLSYRELIANAEDKDPAMAFRKALTEYANRSK